VMPARFAALALALALVLFLCTVARADPVADYYRGRSISLILSAGPGGGYAAYARAFAPYFSAHIPGRPDIVIKNMPGGGGIRAMLYLYSVAPKDGTTLGLVHSSVPFAPLYGIKAAAFDPHAMNWIGSIDASTGICVAWHTSGIATWKDLLTKPFTVGSTGAGSQMETMPLMLNHLFGTKIRIIGGYVGGNDIYLAMERGEVQGRCGGLISSIRSTRPDWFPQHKVHVPIQIAEARNPLFPDVPAIAEFARDEQTKKILRLLLAPLQMDRPILAPPGVPAARVAALRAAFHAAMNDPAFIAQAEKDRLEIREISGSRVAKILNRAYAMPPEIGKAAKAAMSAPSGE
ncbi:MAG: Bug family tripartite tricarboxylate transporter substrate binding protein, partial [Pseudomonadota bacterium]